MKIKSILFSIIATQLLFTSCKDDFAGLNVDPTTVSKGNIQYLFTKGLQDFEPSGYTFWFYNARYMQQWSQAFAPGNGFRDNFNRQGELGEQGGQTYRVLIYFREVSNILSQMDPKDAQKYESIKSMFYPLLVYLGMFDTDMYGDMPFTEACMARYSKPILLTPKYDKMEDLYDLWLKYLDTALKGFEATDQITIGSQDFVYKGDVAKWAKFTNSLKLKLAVRYLNINKSKAIQIAEEAASNKAGLLDGLEDDFIYNRATTQIGDDGDSPYHFGNSVSSGVAAKPVVDLLIKNRDPRVRFFYSKNDFNSKVVQGFFDANKKLPKYIEQNVNYSIQINGEDTIRTFTSWKSPGEPWVRYYGIPTDFNASFDTKNLDYFDSNRWKIAKNDAEITYTPYSTFQEELVRGRVDYTYPDVPGSAIVQDKVDMPWYGLFFSTSEVNLYLAEFKLLGANLPQSAEYYYSKGVEFSVKSYDKLASLNSIPYYFNKYDSNEELIALKNGEITSMMANEDYKLTGTTAEKLEKVYIQEYLHFMYQPDDQYITVKRSGVPRKNSSILPWKEIAPEGSSVIPRRFDITTPSPTDIMHDIIVEAAKRQGFTFSIKDSPEKLNSERIWNDIGSPNFGEGPKTN